MKIGDKTLFLVGLITFFVTLGCVSIILIQIGGIDGITGFATTNTTTGFVNVSVISSVTTTLSPSTINFGDGTIAPFGITTLSSLSGISSGGSGFDSPTPFTLTNTGNVYVNVTVNGSTTDTFFNSASGNTNYTFYVHNVSTIANNGFINACHNGNGLTATDYFETHYEMDPTSLKTVCPNMSYDDSGSIYNAINISINLNLSTSVANGTYSDTLTFDITSLGHS